jgi:hypothetical protein
MWIFEIEHDLVDEGGVDVIEYYVTAEDSDSGEVLRHVMTFRSHELFIDPENGEALIVDRPAGEAEAEVRVLLAAARSRGEINRAWWYQLVEGDPA